MGSREVFEGFKAGQGGIIERASEPPFLSHGQQVQITEASARLFNRPHPTTGRLRCVWSEGGEIRVEVEERDGTIMEWNSNYWRVISA